MRDDRYHTVTRLLYTASTPASVFQRFNIVKESTLLAPSNPKQTHPIFEPPLPTHTNSRPHTHHKHKPPKAQTSPSGAYNTATMPSAADLAYAAGFEKRFRALLQEIVEGASPSSAQAPSEEVRLIVWA